MKINILEVQLERKQTWKRRYCKHRHMLGCRSCHLESICSIALGTRQTFSKLEIKFMGTGKRETSAKMNYETKIFLTENFVLFNYLNIMTLSPQYF